MKTKIDTCKKYWSEFVVPDFQDYEADQGSIRKAFHCAISLFHMADWIFTERDLTYWRSKDITFKNKNGESVAVSDEKAFANALADIDRHFELIRNIANSAKHFYLKKDGRDRASPRHAANTYSQRSSAGTGGSDSDASDVIDRVMLEGPGGEDLIFMHLANSARRTLQQFCTDHGIDLDAPR
jgi:hypothetical protein